MNRDAFEDFSTDPVNFPLPRVQDFLAKIHANNQFAVRNCSLVLYRITMQLAAAWPKPMKILYFAWKAIVLGWWSLWSWIRNNWALVMTYYISFQYVRLVQGCNFTTHITSVVHTLEFPLQGWNFWRCFSREHVSIHVTMDQVAVNNKPSFVAYDWASITNWRENRLLFRHSIVSIHRWPSSILRFMFEKDTKRTTQASPPTSSRKMWTVRYVRVALEDFFFI